MAIEATRLETEEDVRRALLVHRPGRRAVPVPVVGGAAPADDGPPLFRPSLRPPTPILIIHDDGVDTGEAIRIRQTEFVIGRTEGNLTIPHDGQMSSRHAALEYQQSKGKGRWVLVDLKSRNGTFVRVSQALLDDGMEFTIGRSRLRFENSNSRSGSQSRSDGTSQQVTQPWQDRNASEALPMVVELKPEGASRQIQLNLQETWFGTDKTHCQFVLAGDPFVSARHARIYCDADGRWVLENNKSINGVWLKIDKITFKSSCRFLLGEQQFAVQLP